jgi:hypothetical protein
MTEKSSDLGTDFGFDALTEKDLADLISIDSVSRALGGEGVLGQLGLDAIAVAPGFTSASEGLSSMTSQSEKETRDRNDVEAVSRALKGEGIHGELGLDAIAKELGPRQSDAAAAALAPPDTTLPFGSRAPSSLGSRNRQNLRRS